MVKKIVITLLCATQIPCVAMNPETDNCENQKLLEKIVELRNEHNEEIKFQELILVTQVKIGLRTVPLLERLVIAQERQSEAKELEAVTQALDTCLKCEKGNYGDGRIHENLNYESVKVDCSNLKARYKKLAEKNY